MSSSSWWRAIAEQIGADQDKTLTGSWAARVAKFKGYTSGNGSWPRNIALGNGIKQTGASWARIATPPSAVQADTWPKAFYQSGSIS